MHKLKLTKRNERGKVSLDRPGWVQVMHGAENKFFVTDGTLRHDALSYVERHSDRELLEGLLNGEFCYGLTSRQMGKSSLMVRTATRLRSQGVEVLILDLSAIGQDLTREQWYGGLVAIIGRQVRLEEELEEVWFRNGRLGPVQRFFTVIRDVVMARLSRRLVVFIDELDTVRSLDFAMDEFFAAIRECHNRRAEDPELCRLSFCLLGVASPAELVKDSRITPFNLGRRIELSDFTAEEAAPLASGLSAAALPDDTLAPQLLLHRILYWTEGHPYLTQQLCRAVVEDGPSGSIREMPTLAPREYNLVDRLCDELFLSPRAREKDSNLLYVRERLLRTRSNLASLLDLYHQALAGQEVRDDENNDLVNELRLAGIVRGVNGHLRIRNRIYEKVFDSDWVQQMMPDGELEKQDGFGKQAGERFRIKGSCSLGRSSTNAIQIDDEKVSRRHALIHAQGQNEYWLVDLGSSNGTYLNGRRVRHPVQLHSQDEIQITPFCFRFHQSKLRSVPLGKTSLAKTVEEIKSSNCWLLLASLESSTGTLGLLSDEELARSTGRWIAACKPTIEENGGDILCFLGNGLMACWPDKDEGDACVSGTLGRLKRMQAETRPHFRVVIHFGQVFEGGAIVRGEEAVVGSGVSFALGMEKLAASLQEACLLSDCAYRKLASQVSASELGRYPVPGFAGEFQFYGC